MVMAPTLAMPTTLLRHRPPGVGAGGYRYIRDVAETEEDPADLVAEAFAGGDERAHPLAYDPHGAHG
jgi:hypothetical protein